MWHYCHLIRIGSGNHIIFSHVLSHKYHSFMIVFLLDKFYWNFKQKNWGREKDFQHWILSLVSYLANIKEPPQKILKSSIFKYQYKYLYIQRFPFLQAQHWIQCDIIFFLIRSMIRSGKSRFLTHEHQGAATSIKKSLQNPHVFSVGPSPLWPDQGLTIVPIVNGNLGIPPICTSMLNSLDLHF